MAKRLRPPEAAAEGKAATCRRPHAELHAKLELKRAPAAEQSTTNLRRRKRTSERRSERASERHFEDDDCLLSPAQSQLGSSVNRPHLICRAAFATGERARQMRRTMALTGWLVGGRTSERARPIGCVRAPPTSGLAALKKCRALLALCWPHRAPSGERRKAAHKLSRNRAIDTSLH